MDNVSDNSYFLSKEIVKELKCSICKKYLSYPPINIISEDDPKYKCGRCTIKTRVNIRAVMYENLAKHMRFPCIYKKCTKKLPWSVVQDHERNCKYRTLTCIAPDCYEDVIEKEYITHFREKHKLFYFCNSISTEHIKKGMSVLENEGTCYIVLYEEEFSDFKISVCSLENPTKDFDVIFDSKDSRHSIAFRKQKIIPFNEKFHCCKCLLGKCDIEPHNYYKNHKEGVYKYASTKIDKVFIKRTFGTNKVTCNFVLTDQKHSEDDSDEFTLYRDVVIDEVNDDETEDAEDETNKTLIRQVLICQICSVPLDSPIYECLTGHSVCGECRNNFGTCILCESSITNTRNYILEEVKANLKIPDENLITCSKEIMCPLPRCFEKIQLDSITNHFRENHLDHYHFNKVHVDNCFGYNGVDVLVKDNKTYIILFDFDDVCFGISVCSMEPDHGLYEVHIKVPNDKYSITSTNQPVIMFDDKAHCFKCSTGICKNSDHTIRTKRKDFFRGLTTKINRDRIREAFRTSIFQCNIVVIDNSLSQNNKILRQLFECPICKDYMVTPIPQCLAGHTLCHVCKSKVKKCPTCEGKIEQTRNYLLEELSQSINIPCTYETESCPFRAVVKRLSAHELECPSKPKKICSEHRH